MSASYPAARDGAAAGQDPVARFLAALSAEKEAARRADVDALVALQALKRSLLPDLYRASLSAAVRTRLQAEAQRNVVLIRQLVQGLAGILGHAGEPFYDASGLPSAAAIGVLRGRL